MKVYSKLFSLLIALSLLFGVLVYLIKQNSDHDVRAAKAGLEVSVREVFDNLVDLQRKRFETFAYDYSWWQDLIDWIELDDHPDEFLEEQFLQVSDTYGADFFAIYDAEGARITKVLDSNVQDVGEGILPERLSLGIMQRSADKWFTSTYVKTSNGLAELIYAPVQPQEDESRTGPAHGFLAVGRYWDEDFILEMESLSGSSIALNGARLHPDFHAEHWTGSIHFSREYMDFDGVVQAKVDISKPLPVADRIVSQELRAFWLLLIASLAAILVLVIFVLFAVSKPLKKLSRAMQTGDTDHLATIPASQVEFKQLADLIGENFKQKQQLELEIAQRMKTEAELRASRDLAESASKAKSRFLSNISHETRTPLHTISGYASLLQDSALDEEQSQSVAYIRSGCDRLVRMLTDIIDLSSIEADQLTPDLTGLDLQEFLYELIVATESLSVHKPIQVHSEFCQDCPRFIASDYARLRHILMCLLGNAVKFTGEGSVTLRLICSDVEDGKRICFEVEDTGIGIAPEHLEHIFDAFYQADDSDSRGHEGGGLGLAVARGIANLLDAELKVTSELGKGSVFSLTLFQAESDLSHAEAMNQFGTHMNAQ